MMLVRPRCGTSGCTINVVAIGTNVAINSFGGGRPLCCVSVAIAAVETSDRSSNATFLEHGDQQGGGSDIGIFLVCASTMVVSAAHDASHCPRHDG